MDFYEEIRQYPEEKLNALVTEKIKEQEGLSKKTNGEIDIIGFDLDFNPQDYYLEEQEEVFQVSMNMRNIFGKYIPKGIRVVYGFDLDRNTGLICNDGKYYYIDDDSYILEFCKFIKDKEVINEYELFDYLLDFLKDYFKREGSVERDNMFQMIYKTERVRYAPTKEHGISWFKGKGNALCSEYSILANNILNVFGFDSFLVIGRIEIEQEPGENHAFNLISFEEKETKRKVNALIDFASTVRVFDIKFKEIGTSPFVGEIEEISEEFMEELLDGRRHLTFDEYSYLYLDSNLVKLGYNRKRDYFIENELTLDPVTKIKK